LEIGAALERGESAETNREVSRKIRARLGEREELERERERGGGREGEGEAKY
jgi:hypothetical protein